jgi:hypothetical protein
LYLWKVDGAGQPSNASCSMTLRSHREAIFKNDRMAGPDIRCRTGARWRRSMATGSAGGVRGIGRAMCLYMEYIVYLWRTQSKAKAGDRGSLGIHFDRRSQNFAAEEDVALVDRQGLEIKFDGFFNVSGSLFKRRSLRLAALQFRTPCVRAIRVHFDDDTRFADHMIQCTPMRRVAGWNQSR